MNSIFQEELTKELKFFYKSGVLGERQKQTLKLRLLYLMTEEFTFYSPSDFEDFWQEHIHNIGEEISDLKY